MMRMGKCLAIGVVLLIPAVAAATVGPATNDALTSGQPRFAAAAGPGNSTTITVPLEMSNLNVLAAVDMPLSFGQPGDGIELREVRWDERIEYFDVKIANIDNDAKTLLIGLVPLAFDPNKPRMAAGRGPIAELEFEVIDPAMESFTIDTYTTDRPRHQLMWVYSHVDEDGTRSVRAAYPEFEPITIQVETAKATALVPTTYSLSQNYPNPFNAGTVIKFAITEPADVTLGIYNVLGQEVRTFKEHMEAGHHSIQWDGMNRNGDQAASGIYFYRIQANDFVSTKKMTLLK